MLIYHLQPFFHFLFLLILYNRGNLESIITQKVLSLLPDSSFIWRNTVVFLCREDNSAFRIFFVRQNKILEAPAGVAVSVCIQHNAEEPPRLHSC